MTTFTLAGGCFWCLDAVYQRLLGVDKVVSGFCGGDIPYPSYDQVSTGLTGHAESVQLSFDETIIPADVILDIYFLIHDPTTLNRQGNDVGTQYRSAMFYADTTQQKLFESALKRAKKHWGEGIVTEITPLNEFYPADQEHQDYYTNNTGAGYCRIVIEPKIVKARQAYSKWFKDSK